MTDATPAVFMPHINARFCENPAVMQDVTRNGIRLGDCKQYLRANGGPGSISEQIAESDIDVVLGGGLKHFEPVAEGRSETVLAVAAANNYHIITDAGELADTPQWLEPL